MQLSEPTTPGGQNVAAASRNWLRSEQSRPSPVHPTPRPAVGYSPHLIRRKSRSYHMAVSALASPPITSAWIGGMWCSVAAAISFERGTASPGPLLKYPYLLRRGRTAKCVEYAPPSIVALIYPQNAARATKQP